MAKGGQLSLPGIGGGKGGGGGGSRALPDLVSRLRIDSTGVDAAITSLISSFGKADLALAGVAAGLGLIILGGKSMLDIYEKHEEATNSLKQAVESHNDALFVNVKTTVDLSRQEDALTKARNNARLAQLAYTDAVRKHGKHSEEATKAAIHVQDANLGLEQAQRNLRVAQENTSTSTSKQKITFDQLQTRVDQFIQSNRRYVSSQSDVIEGFAKGIRSGLDVTETQRVMNDAVDLAALKHITLADATDVLIAAEHGRMRGLIDLGITTNQLVDKDGNLVKGSAAVAAAMSQVDQKVAGGRKTLTDAQQATNDLATTWQTFAGSSGAGQKMSELWTNVQSIASLSLQFLMDMGHDNSLWNAIEDQLLRLGRWIHDYVLVPLGNAWNFIAGIAGWQNYEVNAGNSFGLTWDDYNKLRGKSSSQLIGKGGKASGGPMVPHGIYTVGEDSEETVVMGARGGYVFAGPKRAQGGDVNIYVNVTSPSDAQEIAAEVGWEIRKLRRAG